MQENEKKILIRVMNILVIISNIGTLMLLGMISLLSRFSESFSENFDSLLNGKISIIQQFIILGFSIILNIISLIFTKDLKKNKTKIAFCISVSMMFGGIYNIIAGFISLIAIYKKKKRRTFK